MITINNKKKANIYIIIKNKYKIKLIIIKITYTNI